MDRERLQQNPLPIDRVARRVTKKARLEDTWRPATKPAPHHIFSSNVLEVAPLPPAAPKELLGLIGRRRGRLTVLGYAKLQGSKGQQAKWVVRCDCGNYEQRTRILRWLGTDVDDMCSECRNREHLKGGWKESGTQAIRRSISLGGLDV